jgi:hypothetical protein
VAVPETRLLENGGKSFFGSREGSALQLQAKLGIGSYKAAWLLLHKLRKAMVDPERDPLEGMVEIDETSIVYRTKDDPVAGGAGRSHDGRLLVAGAVECREDGRPGRIRLSVIPDFSGRSLKGFVAMATREGATIMTDGFSSYQGMEGRKHLPKTVGVMAAHVLLPWDPPRLRQPQAAGARRLSWLPPPPSSGLPRRVRLPLEPTAALPRRLRHAARDRTENGADELQGFGRHVVLTSDKLPRLYGIDRRGVVRNGIGGSGQ